MRNALFLLMCGLTVCVAAQAADSSLIDVEVSDQFEKIHHVADVRGVPFFLKGAVRRQFPQGDASPILLDWKGRFAIAYGFVKDKANILLFDQQGRLKYQAAVAGLDLQRLDEIVGVLVTVLGPAASNSIPGSAYSEGASPERAASSISTSSSRL